MPPLTAPPGLQIWLAVLCGFAALACVRALLLPPWPHARPLRPESIRPLLSRAGLEPKPLPSTALPQTEGLGLSSLLAWRLPQAGELRVVAVHVRRRDDFQLAWITRNLKPLSLQQRRLNLPQDGMASGRIQGRPAYQTCLVPEGPSPAQAAVTLKNLQEAVDRQPRTRIDQLRSVAGLSRNRELRCLLVTLRSATAEPPPEQTWQKAIAALQGVASVTSRHPTHRR